MTLPPQMTVTSGLNAIAHAVEALYAKEANPIIDNLALQGIESIAKALPVIHSDPSDAEARSNALFGAWACGTCLGAVGMSLHHKLCHTVSGRIEGDPSPLASASSSSWSDMGTEFSSAPPFPQLGGTFNMPHAETHTVILPHAAAYNAPYAPEAFEKVARALGVASAPQGLYDLAKNHGAPYSLKALGFKEEDLEQAADIASKNPYPNPAPLEKAKLLQLLRNAYEGTRPE